jgi:hypothetical protein
MLTVEYQQPTNLSFDHISQLELFKIRANTSVGILTFDLASNLAHSPITNEDALVPRYLRNMLLLFMENPTSIITHHQLYLLSNQIENWRGYNPPTDYSPRLLELRNLLGDAPLGGSRNRPIHRIIHTIFRKGYSLIPPNYYPQYSLAT